MLIKDIRCKNLRALARSVGGVTKLAERLEKAQSQLSYLIGNNPIKKIGDKFASHVERTFNKPSGWLDQNHDVDLLLHSSSQKNLAYKLKPTIPIIPITKISEWQTLIQEYFANTQLKDENKFFAVEISRKDMMRLTNIKFPSGVTLILAPLQPIQNGSFIIAQLKNYNDFLLGTYESNDHEYYLNPLNSEYPAKEISHYMIYGVVHQLIASFE